MTIGRGNDSCRHDVSLRFCYHGPVHFVQTTIAHGGPWHASGNRIAAELYRSGRAPSPRRPRGGRAAGRALWRRLAPIDRARVVGAAAGRGEPRPGSRSGRIGGVGHLPDGPPALPGATAAPAGRIERGAAFRDARATGRVPQGDRRARDEPATVAGEPGPGGDRPGHGRRAASRPPTSRRPARPCWRASSSSTTRPRWPRSSVA